MDESTNRKLQTPGLNPFLPFGTYVADGEPKVFGDRLYLYGSYDLFGSGYCSRVYHTFSAPLSDLTHWTDHGVSFSTQDVPWSDAILYAPDALYYKGRYYLFFCLSDGTEGVAESAAPEGPFTNARPITLAGEPIKGIDPSVFAEGDTVYYTWGQFHMSMGELESDFCTLKSDTVRRDVLSNAPGREGFHEGSSLRKFGEKYCVIYASEYTEADPNSGSRPTKLDYAVADSPYGPYERRGTVIDNTGCDPASWNNHGSVIRVNENWYVFYHASSDHSQFSRRARVEKLTVDENHAVILQASPSSSGFLETLPPQALTSPVHACRFFGGAYVTETPDGRFPAVGMRHGAGFAFSPVSFCAGIYQMTVGCRGTQPAKLTVRLGEREAACAVLQGTAGPEEISVCFSAEAGEFPLELSVSGTAEGNLCEIDSLRIGFLRRDDPE